jgi:hypothetical protein
MSDTNKLSWKAGDTLIVHLKAQYATDGMTAFYGVDDDSDDYCIATSNVKAVIPQPEVWVVGDRFLSDPSSKLWRIVGVVEDNYWAIIPDSRDKNAAHYTADEMSKMVRA